MPGDQGWVYGVGDVKRLLGDVRLPNDLVALKPILERQSVLCELRG